MPPKRWATGAAAATRLLAQPWSWYRGYGGSTQAGRRRRHPITGTGTLPVTRMSHVSSTCLRVAGTALICRNTPPGSGPGPRRRVLSHVHGTAARVPEPAAASHGDSDYALESAH